MFAVIAESEAVTEVVGPFNSEEAADNFISEAYQNGGTDPTYVIAEILDPDYFLETF